MAESEGQWITINGRHVMVDSEGNISNPKYNQAINKLLNSQSYGTIRKGIGENKVLHDDLEEFISLNKKYEGNVYRGISVDDQMIKQLKESKDSGNIISMQGISSWSKDEEIAKDFSKRSNEGKKVIFEIKNSRKSVDVTKYSKFKYEQETIMSGKQKFKIVDIQDIKDERYNYTKMILEEAE
jgi:hypothetical protein